MSSKPTRRQISDLVVLEATTHWKEIGIQLLEKKYDSKLDAIELDFSTNNTKCCNEMFKLWLQTDEQATWIKLLDALKAVHLITLADDIKKSMYIILFVYRMSC